MEASFVVEVETISEILDHLDYFQVLKLEQGATPGEIKAAYHRESRTFHPDRFFHLGNRELSAKVLAIHKRITEAYTVLRDEGDRRRYLERIQGPEREAHLRWRVEERSEPKQEVAGTTESGKKLYGAALVDLEAGRLEAAEKNLKMALVFEPQNEHYRGKFDEVRAALKASLEEGNLSST